MKSNLFSPYTLRGVTFKNRIFVSPMCQYSAVDGIANMWHQVHLGSRAVGGAGAVIVEATAVSPEGRITHADLGLWNEAQVDAFRPITRFVKENGAVPGIQLAHAGRKASVNLPWLGGKGLDVSQGGWAVEGPSALPFDINSPIPKALEELDIVAIIRAFVNAAERALQAGFEFLEIHAAHGYLLHEFLSPLSNKRADAYGGTLENRMRLVLDVAAAVRKFWPEQLPLFVRLSATDWVDGGWDLQQSVTLAGKLKEIGVDLIDTSSGGLASNAKITVGPGYQVPFAAEIKRVTGIATGAVGMITSPQQAEQIIAHNQADIVLLAREMLRDPYWPRHAAQILGEDIAGPVQYERSRPTR